MKLNWRYILSLFGILLLMESFFMMVTTGVALYYSFMAGDKDWSAFAITTAITITAGLLLWLPNRKHHPEMTMRESFLIVALTWILFSLFGMLPYLLSGSYDSITNAFFETMAGFTTTGCSSFVELEVLPHGILFWRAITQWMGGLGIVVFSLALLPHFGQGGTQMFNAEVPGLGVEKIRPRIQNTSRRLWGIYLVLTILCGVCYWLCDMSAFDAVCHSLATLSSGGISTHSESLGYFHSPAIECVAMVFMFITGINYSLFYFTGIGRWRLMWRNEELRVYCNMIVWMTLFFLILGTLSTFFFSDTTPEQIAAMGDGSFLTALRTFLFHTVSMVSSTGFLGEHYDYQLWGTAFWIPTLALMVMGGCAGSTAGGLKVVRFTVLARTALNEVHQQVNPRVYTAVRLNGHTLVTETLYKVMAFLLIYLIFIVLSIFVLLCVGLDLETSLGTTISAFGNTGLGIGATGPSFSWGDIPDFGKWYLCLVMLAGRLEIFTIVVLFTRSFWRK